MTGDAATQDLAPLPRFRRGREGNVGGARGGGSGRVGWRLGLRGDKERSGVGRLGLWPVGPARSGGGGQLGHLAQRGRGVCCFCFVLFSFHLFLFIYFPFCFIQFKIFMHFLNMCFHHHN